MRSLLELGRNKKIFVSYKYSDNSVYNLNNRYSSLLSSPTTVRCYVDKLQDLVINYGHINKGENDGEDLSNFSDSTIASKLRDKIYDSSITIVVISPKMKEHNIPEKFQWIPWEISYSLKEHTRNGRTSKTNSMLALVLPDKNNSYDYFIEQKTCCNTNCRLIKTDILFNIIKNNIFNIKVPNTSICQNSLKRYHGEHSYIYITKWDDFQKSHEKDLDKAIAINYNINNYNIKKEF